MPMGQNSASTTKMESTSTTHGATVSKATPVSSGEARGFSDSDMESEEEDSAPARPLAPPPGVIINGEMDADSASDADGSGTNFPIVIQQTGRPASVMLNIDGSLPVLEGLTLPPPPPSPPASVNSDSEGDNLPTVPTTAPPPIPTDLPLIEEDEYSPSLPTIKLSQAREDLMEHVALPTNGPPPIPDDQTAELGDLPPALPSTRPPLISDDSTLDSTDDQLPPLLPGISESSSLSDVMSSTQQPKDGSSASHGLTQLEICVKKRANSELGVTVVASEPPTSDLFMIRRVKTAGVAHKDGRLKSGDRLVAVNGKSLAGLSHAVVLQELNSAPKDCRLTIWRDPSFEGGITATTPTFSGSRTSLIGTSDEEDERPRRNRSLSNQSLDTSPLAMARKRSAGRGLNPRDSPLVHRQMHRLSAPLVNGTSPLSKRWSAEDVPLIGPAGEPLDLFLARDTGLTSQLECSPERDTQGGEIDGPESPPTSTPPLPPGTPPTSTPPLPPGTPPTSTPPLPPGTPPTSTPPLLPGTPPTSTPPATPPTSTPPLLPGTPLTSTPLGTPLSSLPGTPPPQIPSAPPPTLHRGMRPLYGEDSSGEASPILVQATPPPDDTPPLLPEATLGPDSETAETPPPLEKATPPPTGETDEAPPPPPKATPPPTSHVTSGADDRLREVERPKSLGPVPKGKRLEDAPFEIEVTRGLIGGLGVTVCENELGMIAIKALTNRSPITKDGNIRIGDHLISINDESLLGKRAAEAEAIFKSLPRGPVRIVAMAPPRDVTGKKNRDDKTGPSTENLKPTPSTSAAPLNSKHPLSSLSEVPSISPSGKQMVDEEGIVRVLLHRYGGRPLGISIEGGSDTPLKYIYIQSLSVGTPASNCGLLSRGDQIVMLGEECLIGKTHQEAKKLIASAPDSVEIVAQRKQSPKQVMKSSIPENRILKSSGSHSGSETDLPNIGNGSSSVRVVVSQPDGELSQGNSDTALPEPPPLHVATVPEERLTVLLEKRSNERLGLSITGGTDNPSLPDVHVKKILPDSLAGRNGQLKRGDRIISVNGNSLERVTHKHATELLRKAGDHVTLVVARKLGRRVSTAVTPFESRLASRQGSGENTRRGSKRSSPQAPKRLVKTTSSSGENSQSESRGQTPPTSIRRHNRRQSLGHSGEVLAFSKGSTLPRKVGSKVGVRLVELHKGPTGLGMQIQGGKDRNCPITVKMVISGGVAHKSGKIHPGDVILEANSISFENLTHGEAMKTLKGFPQGQVSLIIRDRTAVAHTRT